MVCRKSFSPFSPSASAAAILFHLHYVHVHCPGPGVVNQSPGASPNCRLWPILLLVRITALSLVAPLEIRPRLVYIPGIDG